LFDEKVMDDPQYIQQVKAILAKYSIDFELWRQGIVVHKANCVDPASEQLNADLGIDVKLIAPKVKQEEFDSAPASPALDSSVPVEAVGAPDTS